MEKRIYTCATAHLDTIWNWDFEHTIHVCLYNTLVQNFRLFEKYPDYKFNFEGTYRYELMEEYYPALFKKMKEYIAQGRWNVTGSAYENGDVNVPSPEALFRNILYGNNYFDKTFGKRSKEIYLPDCFGFGWALPSVIKHANLLGFTTQKLTWGSAYGVPFDIGKWYGVDGKYCFACTNPDEYVKTFDKIRNSKFLSDKLKENETKYGLPWTFGFHGAGDQGGAPKEKSVQVLCKDMHENAHNEVQVLSSASDAIYHDLNALPQTQKDKLPEWRNELLMTNHAVGGYTSRAIGKRWNRRCEELADMAERSCTAGAWLGGMTYPQKNLETAWKRTIAHQFHDDLPGTSVQREYRRSWNDYVLSMNQFENEYTHGVQSVAQGLDTEWVTGLAIVVNNSMEFDRRDLVKCEINIGNAKSVAIYDKDGRKMPAQISHRSHNGSIIHFIAEVKSLGCKVYDLVFSNDEPHAEESPLTLSQNYLENQKYIVRINTNGEVCSIFDKQLEKELLKEPLVFDLMDYYGSKSYPAWELNYKEVMTPPKGHPVKKSIELYRSGDASVALAIRQTFENSRFKTIVSLDNGGETVKFQTELRWKNLKTLVKNRFAFTVSNPKASYDLGLGVIERGTNTEQLFEVPAQKWADLSNRENGITVISDSKYGWDKPTDDTLRLTAVHTPFKAFYKESMQGMMDLGYNKYSYALYSHKGGYGSQSQKEARMFNQPMTAFIADKHTGVLGAEFSFGSISEQNVILRCIKKAEDTDEIVVRFNEGSNQKAEKVRFTLGNGIESAREIYASEEPIGDAAVQNGALVFDLEPFEVKSFALTLKPYETPFAPPEQKQVKLEGNFPAFQPQNQAPEQLRSAEKLRFPSELRPDSIHYCGIDFTLNPRTAVACKGQKLHLVEGWDKMYILVTSMSADKKDLEFRVGDQVQKLDVPCVDDYIGRWDLYGMNETAHIKKCRLAHTFTHAHTSTGDDVLAHQMYLFCCELELNGARTIQLPNDSDVLLFAATAIRGVTACRLGYHMYDQAQSRPVHLDFTAKDKWTYRKSFLPHSMCAGVSLVKRDKGL